VLDDALLNKNTSDYTVELTNDIRLSSLTLGSPNYGSPTLLVFNATVGDCTTDVDKLKFRMGVYQQYSGTLKLQCTHWTTYLASYARSPVYFLGDVTVDSNTPNTYITFSGTGVPVSPLPCL